MRSTTRLTLAGLVFTLSTGLGAWGSQALAAPTHATFPYRAAVESTATITGCVVADVEQGRSVARPWIQPDRY